MSNQQKAILFLNAGLIMLLGTVGGVEQCLDLATWDGMYLLAFALVGLAFLALGAGYANAGTDETLQKLVDNSALR